MSIHFDSGSTDIVCMGIFALFFVSLLVIALVYNHQRKQHLQLLAQQFGFQPVKKPDEEFLSELNRAYSPAVVSQVKNVFQRRYADEDLYLLDIYSRSGLYGGGSNNEENAENSCMVYQSPHLDLPQFFLLYRQPMPGQLGGFIESMMEKVLQQSSLHSFQEVSPEFDLKYSLYVTDDSAAASCFTPAVLESICRMDSLYCRGFGKILVITTSQIRQGRKLDSANFNEYINTARSLCDLLVK